MASLKDYDSVETCLIARISAPSGDILFSDYNKTLVIGDDQVTGLGNFLGITASTSELRVSSDNLTLTITGLPVSSVTNIINSNIKGSRINVFRAFFDPVTEEILPLDQNPLGRFFGIVVNYNVEETWDYDSRTSSIQVGIICSSLVSVLENTYTGRRTNSADQKRWFPTDLSMDRVTALQNSSFQFGAGA
jgi:hypothetical protein